MFTLRMAVTLGRGFRTGEVTVRTGQHTGGGRREREKNERSDSLSSLSFVPLGTNKCINSIKEFKRSIL